MFYQTLHFAVATHMFKKDKQHELFRALDRFIIIVASLSVPLLMVAYFALPRFTFINDEWRGFLQAILTELIPIPLLFIVTYVAYRKIQNIRSNHDTEVLAATVADFVKDRLDEDKGILFLDDFPKEINSQIEKASELWLVGVTLDTPVKKYYSMIEQKLREGHRIKVMTVDPNSLAVDYAEMRIYASSNKERTKADILNTLQDFCSLRRVAPDKLLIRTINHPLGNGIVGVNPDSRAGLLYIANYPFRTKAGSLPKFVLRPLDGRWYDLYRQELQNLWDAGIDWNDEPY
jgi:hypothetical protein